MTRIASVFISTFFLSVNFGAVLYVNSTLLKKFFTEEGVSLLFVLGAVINILLFLLAPKLIETFGKRFLLFILLTLLAGATLSLAFATSATLIAVAFLVYSSVFFIIYYILDIFLEEVSKDRKTGEIRGLYLTTLNLGILIGPLILAFITVQNNLNPVYLAAGLMLLPCIAISLFDLKSEDAKWHGLHRHHTLLPLKTWWRTKSIRHITLAKLVLEIFFAIMIINVPIYLHSNIGFDWDKLGIMFTIMLLPFVLLEWPAGKIADEFWGEKELTVLGFLIMIMALVLMPTLGQTFILWTVVLLFSRVGASLIEVMADSYFFKHVDGTDTRIISIFRLARPTGIIIGSVLGAVSLNLFSFENIFFILAIVALLGLRESLAIHDTR